MKKEGFLRVSLAVLISGGLAMLFLEIILLFFKNACGFDNLEISLFLKNSLVLIITAIVLWKITPFITGCEPGCKGLRAVTIMFIAISIGLFCDYLFFKFADTVCKIPLPQEIILVIQFIVFTLIAGPTFCGLMGKWGFPPKKSSSDDIG